MRVFEVVSEADNADVIIINTCSVRESTETKVYGQLGVYKSQKEKRGVKIILTGCMAGHDEKELLATFSSDIMMGFPTETDEDAKEVEVIIKSVSKYGNMLAVTQSRESVIVKGGDIGDIKKVKIKSLLGSTLISYKVVFIFKKVLILYNIGVGDF